MGASASMEVEADRHNGGVMREARNLSDTPSRGSRQPLAASHAGD